MKITPMSRCLLVLLAAASFSVLQIQLRAAAPAVEPQLIKVATAHSALNLMVASDGRVYQLGFGSGDRTFAVTNRPPPRETEFHPQYGDGFILEPALQVTHADGN